MPVSCYLSFCCQQSDKVEADCLLARMEITNAALLKQTISFSIKAVKVFSSQESVASVHLSPTHLLFFSSDTVAGEWSECKRKSGTAKNKVIAELLLFEILSKCDFKDLSLAS